MKLLCQLISASDRIPDRFCYGISVAESETFLLAKHLSVVRSEEKRLPFAGYDIICFSCLNQPVASP